MIDLQPTIRPSQFCQFLLRTQDAAEQQTRRRKRDQTPDRLGLAIRRELLERAVSADPPTDQFEAWLLEQVLTSSQPGPVRAMCALILGEYRFAEQDPAFRAWLLAGAPNADSDEAPRVKSDAEVASPGRHRSFELTPDEHWCPICSSEHVRDG